VKTATDKGFVVVGHEEGQKDREWAFAFDGNTRIDADGKTRLREGDAVTVSYMARDGKMVAQNVKVKAR
jgi:cold shock CspA family protein